MELNPENRLWVYTSSSISTPIDEAKRNKIFFKTDSKTGLQNLTPSAINFPFLKVSKGVKRKRSMGHSVLEDESEIVLGLACSASTSDGGSSGTNMSPERLCGDETKAGACVDLGLGLACLVPEKSSESMPDCPPSPTKLLTSGHSATVASFHSELSLNSHGNQNHCRGLNMFLGTEGSDLSNTSGKSICGTHLRLGLSGNSVDIIDSDPMSLGLVLMDGMHEKRPCNMAGVQNIPVVDEGSTSARSIKSGGYIPSLLMARKVDDIGYIGTSDFDNLQNTVCPKTSTEIQMEMLNVSPVDPRTSDSTNAVKDRNSSRTCKFLGCTKGARGASGLCIAHGGGRRCQKEGCNKGAEGRTIYCKAHGGGRRCQSLGCTKSAEGRTDYCISHGGGRRCSYDGCTKAARGKSGMCIRHGGGRRCQKEGCTKSAEGCSGLCIAHGGGRRCQYSGCAKGAQGSTTFCKAHGGGKRCMIQGCSRGAEGSTPLCKGHGGGKRCMFDGGGICTKSVHGGTQFCVAHGGGKRCAIQGCTKSARGRTDHCVRHGGGRRCKFEGCDKSAQGSTDLCKAHGGGRRCSWGQEGSEYNGEHFKALGRELFKGPCDKFARGKTGLCAAHNAFVEDQRIHGGAASSATPGIGPGIFWGLASGSADRRQFSNNRNSEVIDTGKDNVKGICLDTREKKGSYSRTNHRKWMTMTKPEKAPGEARSNPSSSSSQVVPSFPHGGASLHGGIKSSLSSSIDSDPCRVFSNNYLYPVAASSSHKVVATTQEGTGLAFANEQRPKQNPPIRPLASFVHDPSGYSLIPPNVLVPQSMQRREGRKEAEQVCRACASDDRDFDLSSLSLTEERVHGGGLMALLASAAGTNKPSGQENS